MKVVSVCDSPAQLDHLIGSELNDPPAASADHVVVRVFSKGVLVVGLFDVEAHLFEDAAVYKQGQGPIDR